MKVIKSFSLILITEQHVLKRNINNNLRRIIDNDLMKIIKNNLMKKKYKKQMDYTYFNMEDAFSV